MEELGALLETGGVAAVELAASALAERGEETPPCPSCGKPMIGPFCAICGQPRNTHRRSLRHLVGDFVKDIVSFDSRILRTGRALLFNPGELPNAFRQGRTQPYVPAVRLYLFVSLLFFLFLSATGLALVQFSLHVEQNRMVHDAQGRVYNLKDGKRALMDSLESDRDGNISSKKSGIVIGLDNLKADGSINRTVTSQPHFFRRISHVQEKLEPDVATTLDELKAETAKAGKNEGWFLRGISTVLNRMVTDPGAINEPLTAWIPRILFVLLPLFAALLTLFYRRLAGDFLFVDHLVFSLTMHSFAFVLLIGAAILAQVMGGGWVALIAWGLLSAYFLLSLKAFYRQGWGRTVAKFVGISFVYAVFFLGPAISFAIVASLIGFS